MCGPRPSRAFLSLFLSLFLYPTLIFSPLTSNVRAQAIKSLLRMEEAGAQYAEALGKARSHHVNMHSPAVRTLICDALGCIGQHAKTQGGTKAAHQAEACGKWLAEAFRDHHEDVRKAALMALGKIGDAGKEWAEAARQCLEDDMVEVRWACVEALCSLGCAIPEGAIDTPVPVKNVHVPRAAPPPAPGDAEGCQGCTSPTCCSCCVVYAHDQVARVSLDTWLAYLQEVRSQMVFLACV
jgi:hypothetical protein